MKRTRFLSASACATAALWTAIAAGAAYADEPRPHRNDEPASTTARAAMKNAANARVGDASLEQTPNGVILKVNLRGVPPGVHAFHVHETGRCDAPAFTSAGGHFAPAGSEHGFRDPKGPHAGDLPNVHVPPGGDVSFEYFVRDLSLASLLDGDGAALVMHREPDDYQTEPAGDAGDRIACGVVAR